MSTYRPITLLNCDYKLLARVLVSHLPLTVWWINARLPSCRVAG